MRITASPPVFHGSEPRTDAVHDPDGVVGPRPSQGPRIRENPAPAARARRTRRPPPSEEVRVFNLIPREEAFFELFEKAAANAHQCTVALAEFLERWDDLEGRMRRIK